MKKLFLTIALVIGFILPSHASHAEIKWRRGDFFSNQGGLNDAFSSIAIAVNEAADLQNVVLTTGGAIKTRGGFDNINSTATVTGTGLAFYRTVLLEYSKMTQLKKWIINLVEGRMEHGMI